MVENGAKEKEAYERGKADGERKVGREILKKYNEISPDIDPAWETTFREWLDSKLKTKGVDKK